MSAKTIINLAHRPVTFRCNSGEFRHLPPRGSIKLPEIECEGNDFVEKLRKRGILKVEEAKKTAKSRKTKTSKRGKRKKASRRKSGKRTSTS